MSKTPAIGIVLGTAYTCVGICQNGQVNIIPNENGERKIPSYVAFTDMGRLVGESAENHIAQNPTNTVFDIMRLVGRKYEDKEVQENIKSWPFKVIKDPKSDRPKICITYKKQEKTFYAESISAFLILKLKQIANNFLGKEVKDAIITVPAYFNDEQRKATKYAGLVSGLNVIGIINEPIAAAIAYGFNKKLQKKEQNLLIFDLGGGTLDVSLLDLKDGSFEIKAINGNKHLGGEDFNNKLVEYCIDEFKNTTSIDIKNNTKALRKVRAFCEKAKRSLSIAAQVTIDIENLVEGKDFNIIITRSKFEDLCIDLFKKCITPLENVLKDSKMNKSQIDEIILVGGSTHIPRIQTIIKEFFNGKEPKKNINPDEAAAYGAAIQAVIMSDNTNEKIEKPIMNNIIPLSIGIETEYGIMNVLIPRNSTIPCQKSKIFYFRGFIQTSVIIKVFEGERLFIKDNHYLDEFILDGIFPGSKLQPIIEITLYIDENLVLYVTAVEKNSRGKNDKIIINYNKKRLSKDDIEKHIKEAEKFKDEDNKDKQRIEAKYTLVNYCYKILREVKDIKIESQFSKNEREQIKTKVNGVLKWIQDNNAASKEEYDIKEKEIEDLVIPIMKNIYSQLEIGQEKMFIFPKKWSIESNGLFLPEGVNDSSDYTGKYKNNLEQGNSQSLTSPFFSIKIFTFIF